MKNVKKNLTEFEVSIQAVSSKIADETSALSKSLISVSKTTVNKLQAYQENIEKKITNIQDIDIVKQFDNFRTHLEIIEQISIDNQKYLQSNIEFQKSLLNGLVKKQQNQFRILAGFVFIASLIIAGLILFC